MAAAVEETSAAAGPPAAPQLNGAATSGLQRGGYSCAASLVAAEQQLEMLERDEDQADAVVDLGTLPLVRSDFRPGALMCTPIANNAMYVALAPPWGSPFSRLVADDPFGHVGTRMAYRHAHKNYGFRGYGAAQHKDFHKVGLFYKVSVFPPFYSPSLGSLGGFAGE